MVSPSDERRARQRILWIGVLAAFLLFVVGASIFVNRIEDDLEARVPEELAAAGHGGVVAEFSGQDGTLYCTEPLADPEAALDIAYDVKGVRALELERSCRVLSATTSSTSPTTAPPTTEGVAASQPTTTAPRATSTSSTTVPASAASVADIIAHDPQFSLLSVLVVESGLDAMLGDVGADPVTMFAPTDAAFDHLGADMLAQLRSEPELLRDVLDHHLVAGRVASAELVTGPLETLHGDTLDVVTGTGHPDDPTDVTVDGVAVVEPDLRADNGMLHVVAAVLLPADLDANQLLTFDPVTIRLSEGLVTLTGTLPNDAARVTLVAATTPIGSDAIDDRFGVDPAAPVDAARIEAIADLVEVLVSQFVDGAVAVTDGELSLTGVAASEDGRRAAQDVADRVGATTAIEVQEPVEGRPASADDVAAQLQTDLNDFVAANPIEFESGTTTLAASGPDVLDQLAVMVTTTTDRAADVKVVIEGHTDSDGDPQANRVLSQARADAVLEQLVTRGVAAERLEAVGFGSTEPILVAGVEDKDASRRVEFTVVAVAES